VIFNLDLDRIFSQNEYFLSEWLEKNETNFMVIDLFFLLVLGMSFFMGYSKGIVKSTFGILSILLAFLVSMKFSFVFINLLESWLGMDPRLSLVLGFILCFILIMLGIRVIGKGVEQMLETAHINFINKMVGGLASALIALALFSTIIWFLNQIKMISSSTKESSKSYTLLESFPEKSKWIWSKTKPLFSEFWNKTNAILDGVELNQEQPQSSQKDSL